MEKEFLKNKFVQIRTNRRFDHFKRNILYSAKMNMNIKNVIIRIIYILYICVIREWFFSRDTFRQNIFSYTFKMYNFLYSHDIVE